LLENVQYQLPFEWRMAPNRAWSFWAQLMGAESFNETSPGIWDTRHTFEPDNPYFGTFMAEVGGTDIFQTSSLYTSGCTIAPNSDGFMQFTFDCIGNTIVSADDDTLANTSTTVDTVTYGTLADRAPFSCTVIRMNDYEDPNNVDLEPLLKVTNWSLTVNRSFKTTPVNGYICNGAEKQIQLPVRDGVSEIFFEITFDEYTDLSQFQDFKAGQLKKAVVDFWINSSFTMRIAMPLLQPEAPEASTPGKSSIPLTLRYRALEAATAPPFFLYPNALYSFIRGTDGTTPYLESP